MTQPREGRRIPGVKKLCQKSENSAKPPFIHGHMFGGPGIPAGSIRSMACITFNDTEEKAVEKAEPEGYTSEDGLLYCGSCLQPKEAYFPEGKTFFGRGRHTQQKHRHYRPPPTK